jgi:hypothetical protein
MIRYLFIILNVTFFSILKGQTNVDQAKLTLCFLNSSNLIKENKYQISKSILQTIDKIELCAPYAIKNDFFKVKSYNISGFIKKKYTECTGSGNVLSEYTKQLFKDSDIYSLISIEIDVINKTTNEMQRINFIIKLDK